MLYCPKCQATYTDGTQRFCTNEGARLQPYGTDPSSRSRGIFTSILSKNIPENDSSDKSSSEHSEDLKTELSTPPESKFFKQKDESKELVESAKSPRPAEPAPELEIDEPDEKPFQPIPIARIIDPSSIPERAGERSSSIPRRAKNGPSPLFSPDDEISLDVFEDESQREFEIDPDDPLGTAEFAGDAAPEFSGSIDHDDLLSIEDTSEEFERDPEVVSVPAIELDPESSAEIDVRHSIPPIELELRRDEKSDESAVITAEDQTAEDEEAASAGGVPVEAEKKSSAGASPSADSIDPVRASEDESWEKRSSDAADREEATWYLYPVIGILILLLGAVALYFLLRSDSRSTLPANNTNVVIQQPAVNEVPINSSATPEAEPSIEPPPQSALLDIPPPPRIIKQPPNTILYKNEKRGKDARLAQKFLGFSIYYPKNWKLEDTDNKFLDIARRNADGIPIKQILISQYDSNGTFEADKALFPQLVRNSNLDLEKILSNYNVLSEGEIMFQNRRWRAYEVKFQGIGGAQKLTTWGRRLWIPVQKRGMTSGFIITIIATSLATDINGVDGLESDKEIEAILKTFEPDLK